MRLVISLIATCVILVGCSKPISSGSESDFISVVKSEQGELHLVVPKQLTELLYYPSLASGVGSNDIGLDRGMLGNSMLVSFEAHSDRVLLRQKNVRYRGTSANSQENRAVDEAFPDFILWAFPVVSESETHWIVDASGFVKRDALNISQWLSEQQQGEYSIDQPRSTVYWPRTKAFPENTELESQLTYTGTGAGRFLQDVVANSDGFTVRLHHSFVKLPDVPLDVRRYDSRSGYFAHSWDDYTKPLNEGLGVKVITRHRLEKKNPEAQLSEAVTPIVYYLDPGAPEPVRSALLEGGRWWNEAFEAVGYKNAFQVKMLPEDADPMDVRYNVINWVHRATRGWSYGASVIDPRSGEILKGHVTLGSLRVRQDLLIAQALLNDSDSEAAHEMALARIRQLSAHEIGHTIGLAHNFSASESNRASVMDYPHPLIDIVSGNITLENAYDTGIGAWDKLTVAYGYSAKPAVALNALVTSDIGYISDFHARPTQSVSATGHLWDNGANPITELIRLRQVRSDALQRLTTKALNESLEIGQLDNVLVPLYNMNRYQVEAVAKQIAGVNLDQVWYQQKTVADAHVSKGDQANALKVLLDELQADNLVLPESLSAALVPHTIGFYSTRESSPSQLGVLSDNVAMAEAYARHVLTRVLVAEKLNRMVYSRENLSIEEMTNTIFDALVPKSADDSIQGLVKQRVAFVALERIKSVLASKQLSEEAKTQLWSAVVKQGDHYEDAQLGYEARIKALISSASAMPASSAINELPPGSPI